MLIFVQNKERAKELYNELRYDDIKADVIHADLSEVQVSYSFPNSINSAMIKTTCDVMATCMVLIGILVS